MLPLTIFFALFAIAITRLPKAQGASLTGFFHALANAMLLVIGWVLWIAPLGVAALAFGVGSRSGGGAFAVLGHYILVVSAMGAFIDFWNGVGSWARTSPELQAKLASLLSKVTRRDQRPFLKS